MSRRRDSLPLPSFWDGVASVSFDGAEDLGALLKALDATAPAQLAALREVTELRGGQGTQFALEVLSSSDR